MGMRIEIYSHGEYTAASYQSKLNVLYNKIDKTISELDHIKKDIGNVNSGINTILEQVQNELQLRIKTEIAKKNY